MRYSEEDLEKIYRTNVFGSFYCAKAAVRPMMKSKWGDYYPVGSGGESGMLAKLRTQEQKPHSMEWQSLSLKN